MGKNIIHIGDFETSTGNIDGSTNVYLWGFSTLDKKHRYSGVNLSEFFECIKEHKVKRIYFHNLKWDGNFIVNWLLDNGFMPTEEIFTTPDIPNTWSWMCDTNSSIYDLQVNLDGHIIKFSDTAKLLMASVDDLGKMLGMPKLEIDYDKYKFFNTIHEVPPDLIEYLWRDIDIVIDVLKQFKQSYNHHGLTLGSTALKDFKKEYGRWNFVKKFGGYYFEPKTKKRKYNRVLTVEQWDEYKKGYRWRTYCLQWITNRQAYKGH